MKSDTVKTIAGLVIITIVVVATFLYGNAQRQAQQKRDSNISQSTTSPSASSVAKASPSVSGKANTYASPQNTPKPTVVPSPTPIQTPQPVVAASVPVKAMPATGPEAIPVAGASLLALLSLTYFKSRRRVFSAARIAR